jgi:hypothetical protein
MSGSGSRRLWLRRLRWLAGLWLAGVGAMGLVALAIRGVMRAVGLTL